MEKTWIERQINTYHTRLQSLVYERSINEELGAPVVSPLFIFLTLWPQLHKEQIEEQQMIVALAVGAAKCSFDVHDHVTLETVEECDQLTVLAGDHYSGIYYQILAKHCQFDRIGHFSRAIMAVNEARTTYRFEREMTAELWLHYVKEIEVHLLEALYEDCGYAAYIPLLHLAYPLFLIDQKSEVFGLQKLSLKDQQMLSDTLRAQFEQQATRLSMTASEQDFWLGRVTLQQKEGEFIVI